MVGKDMVVQNFNSLVGSFKTSAVQKQSNVSGDFSKTMSDVQENQSKASDRQVKGKSAADISKGMKKLTASEKPSVDREDRLQLKDTENESVDSENAVVLMSGQVLTPQLLEQGLGELEEKIAELVTDIMGVTEEELMDMLEESGMQLLDLLNPENLKEFVLNANDCENAIELLTNETAATQLSELLAGLKELELGEGIGITKEEITEVLEKHLEGTEKPVTKEEDEAVVEETTEETTVKIVVEKETDTKSASDFSKEESFANEGQDSPKDNPVDVFVQNLAATQTEGVNQPSTEQVQVMKEIVNQVIEQIKIAIKPESTSMELQLNPESLGRVDLTVASKNGVLTASFTAENQIAKEAIESQIQVLKDNLNNQGLKVEAIEVTVSEFGFKQNTESGADAQGQSQGQSKKTAARRINLDRFNEDAEDVSEEEALAARVLRDNGGTVDYTA